MKNAIIFSLSIIGMLGGLVAAYVFGMERKAQPPVFPPVSSPFDSAIYANGIIESDQANASNINVFPEISGPITGILVHEGQTVSAGTLMMTIDDSVQKATAAQLVVQTEAAQALLDELKAEPRQETLAIAKAQEGFAQANLKATNDQYDKRRAIFASDPGAISKDLLDTAADSDAQATSALDVAHRQYELVRIGTWSYDIVNQEKQCQALKLAADAANALLLKYEVRARIDGVVLVINASVGSSVSPQGAYDVYSQGFTQLMVMGAPNDHLAVRCYVDEILVSRLPDPSHIRAQMSIRGTDVKVPLEFVRVQPYVSPKLELSNQRTEKVDLRVLPVVFRFAKGSAPVYPGQLVDVFIGQQAQ